MLYLLETPIGIALFKESDNLILIDKIQYKESSTAEKFINALNNNTEFPDEIEKFFKENLSDSCILNILNPELVSLFIKKYNINAISKLDNNFKKIRTNPFKWFQINKNIYNTASIKLSQILFDGKTGDSEIIESYKMICDLEKCINNRVMRIREWYSFHFPELSYINDIIMYLNYIILIGDKSTLLDRFSECKEDNYNFNYEIGLEQEEDNRKIKENNSNFKISEKIINLAKNSMGVEMKKEDIKKIQETAEDILNDITHKNYLISFLKDRCAEKLPSLNNLIDEILIAKLLTKSGSLLELSKMASSTIQILGAEKAFNEAIKNRKNTPKYGMIFDSKYISKADVEDKGKIARILANKISLCARVDLENNDGEFGKLQHIKIIKAMEKLENKINEKNKPIKQQKRKFISVKEFNEARDLKKQKNN